MPKQDKVPGLM